MRLTMDAHRLPCPTAQVSNWLNRVAEIDDLVRSVLSNFGNLPDGAMACSPQCLCRRYRLSKRIKMLIAEVQQLRERSGSLGPLVAERPPVVAEPQNVSSIVGVESTVSEILGCLGGDEIGAIGIHGGAGMGKTTLLKTINNAFRGPDHGYHVVIFLRMAERWDLSRIQDEISERLGLNLSRVKPDDRAKILSDALSRRRFLLLLDDVPEELDLSAIGIPSPLSGRSGKLAFTTRKKEHSWRNGLLVENYKRIDMRELDHDPSWELFCLRLRPHGENAVRECGGRPSAIGELAKATSVGGARPHQGGRTGILDEASTSLAASISQVHVIAAGKNGGSSFLEPELTKIKAVNLEGWLVASGSVKPSLFDGIPNKELLDGTKVQFKSVTIGKYLCAEKGGGTTIVVDRLVASSWESFRLWRLGDMTFHFRVRNKQFIGLEKNDNGDVVVAVKSTPEREEIFEIVRSAQDNNWVRIKASNGFFIQVKNETLVTADSCGSDRWEDDPSVFEMTCKDQILGEYQLTNGHGPLKASSIMKEHWKTFIVEKDFEFISENGLNAVKIPVGWWIACYPNPPPPFVGGSLVALDNAFKWAEKYGLKVIINLQAAPGSQNGYANSASRDGKVEWGSTLENIEQTIHVIEFLTARYVRSPSLYAVQLLSGPKAPEISRHTLQKYYEDGYDAVRKYTSDAYVIMSCRSGKEEQLLSLADGRSRVVLDKHCFNLFQHKYKQMTTQEHTDYIYINRDQKLKELMQPNGPLLFVGEWVAEWEVDGASEEEYKELAKAQLEVFGRTTFGWAYGSFKDERLHWSLEWMISNGYIHI